MAASERPAIVTTSWDDGHPLDLRLAGLLADYGFRGTFYVPLRYAACPRLAVPDIRRLHASEMEVGSHTVLHPRLTRLNDAAVLRELVDSRDGLEQILGQRVRSFCFPEGKFSPRHRSLVSEAGYELARTTVAFQTELGFDPYTMPVTFQLWPHSRNVLIRHALKERNFSGLAHWMRRWQGEDNLETLAARVMDYVEEFGGMLHIWGHSWEIESRGLWPLLEAVLRRCAYRSGVEYLTNIGVLDAAAIAPERIAPVASNA